MTELAKVVRVRRRVGAGDWFYATSPDLKGLLVAQPTLEALEKAIPQAITDLYAARNVEVIVAPLEECDGGSHGSWVALPVDLMEASYRKPSPAAA